MAPNIDIYVLSKIRTAEILYKFLGLYVDRNKSENRKDEQLMIYKLDSNGKSDSDNNYEGEPALTLSNSIKRALDFPRRSFTIYLDSKRNDIDRVILSFTTDDKIIFGLSIDYENESKQNIEKANQLLEELLKNFNCNMGFFSVELPPSRNEKLFIKESKYRHILGKKGFK